MYMIIPKKKGEGRKRRDVIMMRLWVWYVNLDVHVFCDSRMSRSLTASGRRRRRVGAVSYLSPLGVFTRCLLDPGISPEHLYQCYAATSSVHL